MRYLRTSRRTCEAGKSNDAIHEQPILKMSDKPDASPANKGDAGTTTPAAASPPEHPVPPPRKKKRTTQIYGGIAILVLLAIAVFYYFRFIAPYEDTDDAFIDGYVTLISPRVA